MATKVNILFVDIEQVNNVIVMDYSYSKYSRIGYTLCNIIPKLTASISCILLMYGSPDSRLSLKISNNSVFKLSNISLDYPTIK